MKFSITGGIIGSSTSHGTVQHWILGSHLVVQLKSNMERSLTLQESFSLLKEVTPSRLKFDEEVY